MNNPNKVSFLSDGISFDLDNPQIIDEWIQHAIMNEGKSIGDINYVFCSDEYLYKINLEHLKHNSYTDIITFDYCFENVISSDIFISIDRVKDNAHSYNTTFQNELSRVMIHGVLHLIGYDDKTDSQKEMMRSKEDFYLSLLSI